MTTLPCHLDGHARISDYPDCECAPRPVAMVRLLPGSPSPDDTGTDGTMLGIPPFELLDIHIRGGFTPGLPCWFTPFPLMFTHSI